MRAPRSGRRHAYGFGTVRSIEGESSRDATLLAETLSSMTSTVFFAYKAFSYRELGDGIASGDLGFAWMPPVPAIDLLDEGVATLLALPIRCGEITYNAALIVARGGPTSIEELRGKRAAWVDRESTSGYLVPREHIISLGFDPRSHFSEELFLHGHDNVVDAVVSGRAGVGATFCSIDPVTKEIAQAGWTDANGNNAKAVDILAMTSPIPNDVLVMSRQVPEALGARVLECLMDAAEPQSVFARLLRADGFRAAPSEHFEPLRTMLQAARARGDAPASLRRAI
jgi:phosphonate transport system substrate-binding protein